MTVQTTIDPDDRPALSLRADGRRAQLLVLWLLGIVSLAAFAAAIPGLLWLGQLAHLGGLAVVIPIVVDGGQLVAAAATAVRRSSGRSARWEAGTLTGLVLLSASAQVLHVIALAPAGQGFAITAMAALLAAAMPLTVLAGSHAATRAVLRPVGRTARPTRPTKSATVTAATPAAPTAAAKKTAAATSTAASVRPTAISATTKPVAVATMPLSEAVAAVRQGKLSQRAAAAAAGVSRHAVASALAA